MKKKFGGDLLGWIQDKINPPEMHLPGYNYCGPFTKLQKRLARGDKGVNRVDEACRKHDIAYSKTRDIKQRHLADQEFLSEINALVDPTVGEKASRLIINPIIKTKMKFGLGVILTQCLFCKKKTGTKNCKKRKFSNAALALMGECVECGRKKCSFVKK